MSIPSETWPCSSSANSFLGVKDSDGTSESVCTLFDLHHFKWVMIVDAVHFITWAETQDAHPHKVRHCGALFEHNLRKLNHAILPSYQLANKSASWSVNHCCKRSKCWSQDERRPFASSWDEVLRFVASIKWHTKSEHIEGMVRTRLISYTVW